MYSFNVPSVLSRKNGFMGTLGAQMVGTEVFNALWDVHSYAFSCLVLCAWVISNDTEQHDHFGEGSITNGANHKGPLFGVRPDLLSHLGMLSK